MTWLRTASLRGLALAWVVAVAGGGAAQADEPPRNAAPAPNGKGGDALAEGLAALRVRMEAKLKEADLLQQSGKIEEALAATRDVERLYREGIADLERLAGLRIDDRRTEPATPRGLGEDDWDSSLWPEGVVAFKGRAPRNRTGGGSQRQHDAQYHGLHWLAAHQSPDGGWEAAGFDQWCDGKRNTGEKPDGPGDAKYDVGVTGLALSAFLAAGYTHRVNHPFATTVRKGLAYLKNVQDPEGCFGPRNSVWYVYNHARASLAMVEAFGMTGAPALRGPAQKALSFSAAARNPYMAWRYGVQPGENDTSVTGWMALPLLSARIVNATADGAGRSEPLVVDENAFDGIRNWLDKMTDADTGRVGYFTRGGPVARTMEMVDKFPAEKSESMTGAGVLLRVWMDPETLRSDPVRKGAQLVAARLPVWNRADGSIDLEHWYFGTMALRQVGGDAWARWETALSTATDHQRKDGTYCGFKGSWDPVDPWSPELGRVYSTAVVTLCLEARHRYERFGDPK